MGTAKGAPSFARTIDTLAKNYDVVFISAHKQKYNKKNITTLPCTLGALDKLKSLPLLNYFLYPLWWLIWTRKAYRLGYRAVSGRQPALVYAYEVQAVLPAKWLASQLRRPLVTRFQGTKLQIANLRSLLYKIKYFDHIIALKTPADLVIMTNDGTQGDQVLHALGNKSATRFWLNGVEPPLKQNNEQIKQTRLELGIKPQEKMILMVSRLVPWKRVDRMLKILPKIKDEYRLVVAGDGTEKASLEAMVHNEPVQFLGAVTQEKIDRLFAAADIFVSLYDLSNVGNPLLQAMQTGKAIVTLNNGDTKKFIDNTRGVLLPPNNSVKLANSLNNLITSSRLRRKLGLAAQKYAQQNFWSWQKRMTAETKELKKLL